MNAGLFSVRTNTEEQRKRAYFQEGFLVGSEFDHVRYSTKHDVAHRLLAKFELVGDKENWVRQLSTYARSDVYSEDLFTEIRDRVLSGVGEGIERKRENSRLKNPDLFPSLSID